MSGSEGFLKRWARLKTEQKEKVDTSSSQAASEPKELAISNEKEKEKQDRFVAELPPVESLTKDSDFTAFLRKEVPEALRQQALRKLWSTDPVIAGPDPLDFQNIDYARLVTDEVVTSSYEVGRGFADRLEELAGSPAASKPAEGGEAVKDEPPSDPADQSRADPSNATGSGDQPQRKT